MATLYASSMREKDKNQAKHQKADEHNLRLDEKNDNYDPSLSMNNIYYLLDNLDGELKKVSQPIKSDLEKIREIQEAERKIAYPKHTTTSTVNRNNDIQNSRIALSKWIKSPKTSPEEKEFYEKVLEKVEAREQITEEDLEEFQTISKVIQGKGEKISRFSDKRKRMQLLKRLNFDRQDKRQVVSARKQTEYLFKTPDRNNITWTNEQMLEVASEMQRYFKDYNVLYIAIHHDENPKNPHLHIAFSNFNKRTKKYDLVQAEVDAIKQWQIENNNEYDSILDIPQTKMTDEEQVIRGSLWQDFVFDLVNRKSPIQNTPYTKRKQPEIDAANHDYEKTKPITKREHNRQRKIQEENTKNLENLNKVKSQYKKGSSMVEDLKNSYKTTKKTSEEEEKKYLEIKKKREEEENLHLSVKEKREAEERKIHQIRKQRLEEKEDYEIQLNLTKKAFHDFENDFSVDKVRNLFKVFSEILTALTQYFQSNHKEEARVVIKEKQQELIREHNWSKEDASVFSKISSPEEAIQVVSEFRDEGMRKIDKMKEKLVKAKDMLDSKPVVNKPKHDKK